MKKIILKALPKNYNKENIEVIHWSFSETIKPHSRTSILTCIGKNEAFNGS